jgi:two-component system, OmpR family, sensor histidine kinase KdpD
MDLLASSAPSRRRAIAAAIAAPAVAVALAAPLGAGHLATATALCLLAVVAAAAAGGRGAGLLASVLSFLGLNYFFTEPRHTFAVHQASDLVALFAFLLTALIVGSLLSRALQERARAERRAMEAQLLAQTTAELSSGEPFDTILADLAATLVRRFDLDRCEIATPNGTGVATSETGRPGAERSITIPLTTPSGEFGTLTLARRGHPFSMGDVDLLRTLAAQTALAIERAALDAEVHAAKLDAESSQLRAALFSSVTHDLRTPLSSIKASVSGLLGEGAHYDEEQLDEMLRTVLEETDHLNRIVTNLLDLARMRSGSLVPSKQAIPIEELIEAVLRRLRRALENVPVRTTIRPDLPPIDADPIEIQQVLSNVIENAIRFSSPGAPIEITAARWQDDVQVRIVDHGPGIPAEERISVFEEFYRRDAGSGRGGTGLGLAIARAIVVAHGGRIWIEGTPGGGATVLFELPIARIATPVSEATPEGATP